MSKKVILAGAAALSLTVAPQAAQAYSIVYALNQNTLAGSSATPIQTFDSYSAGASVPTGAVSSGITAGSTGSATVQNIPVGAAGGGFFVRPPDSSGNFLSVAGDSSYTLNFSSAVQYLSFVFGTLDANNQVTFNLSSGGPITLTGAQILLGTGVAAGALGSLGGPGAAQGIVGFHMEGGPGITSVTFSQGTGLASFELDTISTAAPEPATWAMMLLGFGLVGSQLRRRSRRPVKALASA